MALTLSKRISETEWGKVDKTALGNRVAEAYAAGEATKAQVRTVYLYVPDEAFGKDADGKPTFAYTQAKLPVCEIDGDEIVINRAAVGVAAQRVGQTDVSANELTVIKRKLRGLYRKLKATPPDSLKESITTIGRGQELTELVKGSLQYTLDAIRTAFERAFQEPSRYDPGYVHCYYDLVDIFADKLIVRSWGRVAEEEGLAPDEFFMLGYQTDGEGGYTFDPYEQWVVVELTYQPQTPAAQSAADQPSDAPAGEMANTTDVAETQNTKVKKKAQRFTEAVGAQVEFTEADAVQDAKPDGPWRIKAVGCTADKVNANGRRYTSTVLQKAVEELKKHLHESAGQGRLLNESSGTTGEPDHPKDKGNRRPLLLETVVNWDTVYFDGQHVLLEGNLLGTSKGKDIRAQMKGGVIPGISQRGYGESVAVQENGQLVEDVIELTITGYDFTRPGDQSDADSGVTMFESKRHDATGAAQQMGTQVDESNQTGPEAQPGDDEMDPEKLKELIAANPDLFKGIVAEEVSKMSAAQLKALEETVRSALGLDANADIAKELKEAADAKRELAEAKQLKAVEAAIEEATKDLKYGKEANETFVEAIRAAKPQTADEVKALVESKRTEYDKLASKAKIGQMGYKPGSGVQATAPVLESETGVPEFARGAHEITERLVKSGSGQAHNWLKPVTVNEIWTAKMLERFDFVYKGNLLAEARRLEEAEQTADLNLPYSVSRAVIAQVGPQLVAASVFDFDIVNQSPFYLFYEQYVAETGTPMAVTNESVVTDQGAWVALAHSRLTPGTVTVTSSPAGTTYTENDDYVIDYANGRIQTLAAGVPIGDGVTVLANYSYTAIRKGEMQPIERGKAQLSFKTMEAKADRLADQVSSEAIVFGQSQLGWDATGRTIEMLIKEVRRKIDQGIFYLALNAALSVPSNSGGTWNSSGSPIDYADLVRKIGVARVKVTNRYYQPMAIVMSAAMSDTAGNWEGFTAAGARADSDLKATGYVGRLKGLPVFETTEFPDSHVLVANRELVAHRVFRPMRIDGPHKSRDASTGKLISAEEYFTEEYNATEAPVPEKGAYIKIS
jgi:hypothetical protein